MQKIRALIIDDSSVMRKIVERCLRQAGIDLEQVLEAGNGVDALAVLQDGRVDLICATSTCRLWMGLSSYGNCSQ